MDRENALPAAGSAGKTRKRASGSALAAGSMPTLDQSASRKLAGRSLLA
jgi:hypothetical protein